MPAMSAVTRGNDTGGYPRQRHLPGRTHILRAQECRFEAVRRACGGESSGVALALGSGAGSAGEGAAGGRTGGGGGPRGGPGGPGGPPPGPGGRGPPPAEGGGPGGGGGGGAPPRGAG